MQKIKLILIYFFIIVITLNLVNAELIINDLGKNYNNISGINSFSGEYINVGLGYFGNNFNKNNIDNELDYEIPIGYFGNKFTSINNTKELIYITPVGFFGSYSGQILDFGLDDSSLNSNSSINNIKSRKKINIVEDIYLNDNEPYLDLEKNKLSFYNYKGENILLRCFFDEKQIININLKTNFSYQVDDKYRKDFFSCSVSCFDEEGVLKMSNVVYNVRHRKFLTNRESLNFIYLEELTTGEIFEKLYYLFPLIDFEKRLNYQDLSLFLVNIYGNLIIKDKNLSFLLLNNTGLYNSNISKTDFVSFDELLNILSKIRSNSEFKNNLIYNIDDIFYLNREKVFNDLLKIYYINMELSNENTLQKDGLIACLKFEGCFDKKMYMEFDEKINNLINDREAKWLGIDLNSRENINWEIYIEILFKIISKDEFYSNEYNKKEYNKFIGILREAILYSEQLENTKMGFLDYSSLELELITNEKLFNKIKFLTINHLKTINDIYSKLNDKNKLFIIISDYLK